MGIRAEGLTKSFGSVTAVDDVSFEIGDGQFSVFLGATGAGKTTLLRMLCGIERPDDGRVLYEGADVTSSPVRKRPVAMVYQQFVNYPSLTVYENIASPLRQVRPHIAKDEVDRRVRANAALLRVDSLLDRRPEELSGGQQQRTAIARALAKDARYIFLDEPLANLDYKLREELRGELKRIFRDRGGAVVYATAEPIDALAMATHVGMLHEGRLLQYGPVHDVYGSPATADVGAYFSYPAMNLWSGECVRQNGSVHLRIAGTLSIDVTNLNDRLIGNQFLLGIRAYDVHLQSLRNEFVPIDAVVELAEVVGSDTELHLHFDGGQVIAYSQQLEHFDIGDRVRVYLDPKACFVFDADSRALIGKTGG